MNNQNNVIIVVNDVPTLHENTICVIAFLRFAQLLKMNFNSFIAEISDNIYII